MSNWLANVAYLLVGCVVLALVLWAINRGGTGKRQEGAVVFKVRPGVLVMMLVVAGLGIALWALSVVAILAQHWLNAFFGFALGLPFVLLACFASFQSVTLNEQGIVHDRRFLAPIFISWADLTHFEIAANGMMHVLILRPRGEGRSISLSSYGFNTRDLLRRLVQQKPVRQQPVKRQRWYRY